MSGSIGHLRRGGVSLLLHAPEGQPPRVVHWGRDLGVLDEGDTRALLGAVTAGHRSIPTATTFPQDPVGLAADGFLATPGGAGHRGALPWFPHWDRSNVDIGAETVRARAVDADAEVTWHGEWQLDDHGVVRVRSSITNDGADAFVVTALLNRLPVPPRAEELLDLAGRWIREREPQRHPFVHGTFRRQGRHGRTGHDATLLLTAGTPGFGFRRGEVWSVHTAWSGNHLTYAERDADGTGVLGGGELLEPGEVTLAAGETYDSPWLYATWSDSGLDGATHRLHRRLRARERHPRTPRPVVLNTWEAVYYDQDEVALRRLADVAARVGIERFVLDDGWFRGRRDDTAGLGDWVVDDDTWPRGLAPLVEHVTGLGLEFGLWVEPEMVSPDSDLARAHPDWLLHTGRRLPPEWRHQQVLDLGVPDAFDHVLGQLDDLLAEHAISFLKWDHNRDLLDVAAHTQTAAAYRLLDELRQRHPRVEIESCASGGGRIDLEILERTDRVWASDTNDALERQQIQRWTMSLVPPELIGAHIGPPQSHTTGRTHSLGFRAATALAGHFGVEWDLVAATEDELEELAGWIAIAKQVRSLVANGDVVRVDDVEEGLVVQGVVSPDRTEALFTIAAVGARPTETAALIIFPGLSDGHRYRLDVLVPGPSSPVARAAVHGVAAPPRSDIVLPGSALTSTGWRVELPEMESAVVVRLLAVVDPGG